MIDYPFYGYNITSIVGQASLPDLLYITSIGAFLLLKHLYNNELMTKGMKISKEYQKIATPRMGLAMTVSVVFVPLMELLMKLQQ